MWEPSDPIQLDIEAEYCLNIIIQKLQHMMCVAAIAQWIPILKIQKCYGFIQ